MSGPDSIETCLLDEELCLEVEILGGADLEEVLDVDVEVDLGDEDDDLLDLVPALDLGTSRMFSIRLVVGSLVASIDGS